VPDIVLPEAEVRRRQLGHWRAGSIGDSHLDLDQTDLDSIVLSAEPDGQGDDDGRRE
jgi:hypothetical protein